MGIERTASLIHSKLAEITSEAMVELHKRNKRIELKVEESHSTIQRLESLLEEAKLENEKHRLQEEREHTQSDLCS